MIKAQKWRDTRHRNSINFNWNCMAVIEGPTLSGNMATWFLDMCPNMSSPLTRFMSSLVLLLFSSLAVCSAFMSEFQPQQDFTNNNNSPVFPASHRLLATTCQKMVKSLTVSSYFFCHNLVEYNFSWKLISNL